MNDVDVEDGAWCWTEDGDDKMTSKNIPATIVVIDLFDGSVVVVTILIFIVAYLSSNNPLLMQERRKDEGLLYRVLV